MFDLLRPSRELPPLRPKLISPPAADPVSLDEARQQCRIDHNDDDDLLLALISTAIQRLDGLSGALGRCMINQTWRFGEACWPTGGMFIPLPDVSAAVVKYRDSDDVEQTLPPTDYRLLESVSGAFLQWTSSFASPALFSRADAVSFDVTAGFGATADDVPLPLRRAILMLVSTLYENREASATEGQSELPFAVSWLISGYRRNSV
jgi:uncharacterized phiE125 gp8 family phage protein